jgi:hypothetical protein
MKNELSKVYLQIFTMNEMSVPRNNAITALLKLEGYGITDNVILNVYEYLNRARIESAATIRR